MNEIMNTFTNAEAGIAVEVTKHAQGFAIHLKDTDADLYVGMTKIFPTAKGFTLADAEAAAKDIAAKS